MENLKIVELNTQECENVNGGMHWLLALVVGGFIYDVISNPEQSRRAISRGFRDGAD